MSSRADKLDEYGSEQDSLEGYQLQISALLNGSQRGLDV